MSQPPHAITVSPPWTLAQARAELARLEQLDQERRESNADAEQQQAGMREVALFRAANASAVMGGSALALARQLVAALEAQAGRFVISGDLLLEWTEEHTCGTGPEGYLGAHEPGCGLEPVISLADLARMGDALRRTWFRARLHGEPSGGHQRVQVFGGPAGGTRGLLGVLTCRPEEAADLITLLGEAEA